MRNLISSLMLCLAFVTFARAQAPATRPASADFAITPMRVQQLQGVELYVYTEAQTTFADIKTTADRLIEPVLRAADAGRIQPTGGFVFVYEGVTEDMAKPFTMQVGRPVKATPAPAAGAADLKVRKLQPLRAATVVYSGGLSSISKPYPQIYTDLFAAGRIPTGEVRESYVYWEGPDSPNNVVIIQVGVK